MTGTARLLTLMGAVAEDPASKAECYVKSAERPALRILIQGGLARLVRTERLGGKRAAVASLTEKGMRAYWNLQGHPDDTD